MCTAVSVVLGRMAKRRELNRLLLNRTEIRPFIFVLGFMSARICLNQEGGREGGRVGFILLGSSTKGQGQGCIVFPS